MEAIKSYYRIFLKNRTFAYFEIFYYTLQVCLIFLCSLLWQAPGYTAALIITPLIAGFLFFFKLAPLKIYKERTNVSIEKKTFWRYGALCGITNIATQFLFALDILMIGWILPESESVTHYKYLTIIPFSIQFLPGTFMVTDFVSFTKKLTDRKYIADYIKGYMQLFLLICLLFLGTIFVFSEPILSIFGNSFKAYITEFQILSFGVCGILLLRSLFGHLLSAMNKMQVNYLIISSALLLNIVSNYFLIPRLGLKGAAITSAALMWLTGFLSGLAFLLIYRKKRLPSDMI